MGVLLLVRHAQASIGTANYDQLSELGRRQAALAGNRLARSVLRVDHVVSGALNRQRETAITLMAALLLDPTELVIDARLDEYDHVGVLAAHGSSVTFEAATTAEAKQAIQPILDAALARWQASAQPRYVESHDTFTTRVITAVTCLAAGPGTTLAIASGGVIAVAAAHVLGLRMDQWPTIARVMVNGSITKLITGRRGTHLLSLNDHAHLEGDRSQITYR